MKSIGPSGNTRHPSGVNILRRFKRKDVYVRKPRVGDLFEWQNMCLGEGSVTSLLKCYKYKSCDRCPANDVDDMACPVCGNDSSEFYDSTSTCRCGARITICDKCIVGVSVPAEVYMLYREIEDGDDTI